MPNKPVLIVGLFSKNRSGEKIYRTAADQLAQLFKKNQQAVICTSYHPGKWRRLWDTIFTIIRTRKQFTIAILPLYGTTPSFIWQEITARVLKIFKKKIILVVHGGSIPQRMRENAKPFLKALHRSDIVICPSAFMQEVLKKFSISSDVIENVLDLSDYTFIQKQKIRPRLIWMRAFEDIYNPAMAVHVAKILYQQYPEFKMVMAGGDKGMLPEIQEMIRKEDLEAIILLPGYIDLEQKKQFADEYDLFISTNNIDNAPVSIVEFMAMGIPVISTNVGGISYLIEDGVNGFTVTPDDAMEMAEKISSLIEQPTRAIQAAMNAGTFVKKFGEDAVMKKWGLLIENLNNENQSERR